MKYIEIINEHRRYQGLDGSETINQDRTLPKVKSDIEDKLNSDDLSEEDREFLLQQHGIIDDLVFDEAGNLTIYRAMWVTPEWIRNARPGQALGIYWSHDPNTASPYNAEGGFGKNREVDLLIEAILPAKYADWAWIWEFHHQGENEVRLGHRDGEPTPLKVTRIWINKKPMQLPNWIDQIYTDC